MSSTFFTMPFVAPVKTAAALTGLAESTMWARIKNKKIASIKEDGQNGRTLVILDWPGQAPPREGRPPSFAELVRERLADPPQARAMPEGKHRGRPRKAASPTDTAAEPPLPRRRGRPRTQPATAAE